MGKFAASAPGDQDKITAWTKAFMQGNRVAIAGVIALLAIVVLIVIAIDREFAPTPESQISLSYGDFKSQIQKSNVKEIWTNGNTVEGNLKAPVEETNGPRKGTTFVSWIPSSGDPDLLGQLSVAGVQVNPPRTSFYWDFIASAPAFATLAAVLAGFVIVAIVAILTFDPKGLATSKDTPLPVFLTAFLSLVLAAFLYAVIAGNHLAAGIDLATHAEGFFLAWILAVGVVQTCVGISWLLKSYGMRPHVVRASKWICACAVAIAAVSTSGLLVLPLYQFFGQELWRNGLAWLLTLLILILSIPIGYLLRSHSTNETLMQGLTEPALVSVLVATILFSILTGVGNGTVREFYSWLFGLLIFFQFVLGALFTAYWASLPAASEVVLYDNE